MTENIGRYGSTGKSGEEASESTGENEPCELSTKNEVEGKLKW
jgi:hypothetical protein